MLEIGSATERVADISVTTVYENLLYFVLKCFHKTFDLFLTVAALYSQTAGRLSTVL